MRDAAFKLYSDKPELFTCKWPICSEHTNKCQQAIGSVRTQLLSRFFIDNKLSSGNCVVDWETSRLHFLNQRKMEQKRTEELGVPDIISELSGKYKELIKKGFDPTQYGFGFGSITYLGN